MRNDNFPIEKVKKKINELSEEYKEKSFIED